MNPAALAGVRVGSVSYLNARPLIWGLDPAKVLLEVPAKLTNSFEAGKIEVALIPLFEILHLGVEKVVDDVAIACLGPVHSVFVASRGQFGVPGEIYLDPSSRSSVALLQVLLSEFYPGDWELVASSNPPVNASRLIIGDPALEFRARHDGGWRYHDLGELWLSHTGLPFVFAAWALRSGLKDAAGVAGALREVKVDGLEARREIADKTGDPSGSYEYLTRSIRYDLGAKEKEAILLFRELALRHGLLARTAELDFV